LSFQNAENLAWWQKDAIIPKEYVANAAPSRLP